MSAENREGRAVATAERGWIREQAARFAVRLRLAISRRALAVMGAIAGVLIQVAVILIRPSANPEALWFLGEVAVVGLGSALLCALIGPQVASRIIEFVFRLP